MSDTTIKLRRSAVPGKVPTTEQLALGEIALNTYDGKVFIKKDDGAESVISIGERGFTGSQGDIGFTGSQGITGFVGSQGDVGFTGSQGFVGSQGFTGSRGFSGIEASNTEPEDTSILWLDETDDTAIGFRGIPSGGVEYQTLVKDSDTDYDVKWGPRIVVSSSPPENPLPGDIWVYYNEDE
jgi:hypothetical protein